MKVGAWISSLRLQNMFQVIHWINLDLLCFFKEKKTQQIPEQTDENGWQKGEGAGIGSGIVHIYLIISVHNETEPWSWEHMVWS